VRVPRVDTNDIVVFADAIFSEGEDSSGVDGGGESSEFRSWALGLKRLPASAAEEKYIIAIFKEENVTSFIRRDATKSKLFSDKARNAKVLHIATHGYYDPLTPYLVGRLQLEKVKIKLGFSVSLSW